MNNWPKGLVMLAFLSLPLGWLADRRYRQMPHLDSRLRETDTQLAFPSVSIIVPARNEAANLQVLLPSLMGLDYPGLMEVIVVDDDSEDDTAVVAQKHGANVLSLNCLPDGWLGKPHACHRGTAVAGGEWLLFTDADTRHVLGSLSCVIEYALNNQLDGLTCHLHHKTHGLLDSLVLMTAFAGLFAGLPRKDTSLNGQYILLRRDVYECSGGFAAVRQEPLEDLALGHHLHNQGFCVPMLRGDDMAEVSMYQSIPQLWRGMTRIGAGSLRWTGLGSLITALFITALMTPLLALKLVLDKRLRRRWLCLSWVTAVAGIWPWKERFGLRWQAWLAPFGALFVQITAVWGLLNRLIGRGFSWKGRTV